MPEDQNATPNAKTPSVVGVGVTAGSHALVNLLAVRAHRVAVGVSGGHPHLAAERDHGFAGDGALDDLVLAHEVGEALMITFVQPDVRALLGEGAAGQPGVPRGNPEEWSCPPVYGRTDSAGARSSGAGHCPAHALV